jgi:hypothetical protein
MLRLLLARPRPEIDRSASAWLIRKFIDKRARFGHRGEDCTFETLRKEFYLREAGVTAIGGDGSRREFE